MSEEDNSLTDKIVYETDASQIQGHALEVLIPGSIQQLQHQVRINPKITIRAAGTSLVGGAVPQNDTVIDLSKLNKILELDERHKTIVVESGVVLDDLNDFLEFSDLEFPINPSSHAVCTIGGMIATDAVGSRAIRYGKTSQWIEWLEIVDSNGNIHKKEKSELSDFTGLEGITGIISRACLKLTTKKNRTASLIAKDKIREIIEIAKKEKLNPKVSMLEFLDKTISELLNLPKKYHLLIEYESEKGELKDEEYKKIIALRDSAYPLLAQAGYSRIEDPKIYLDQFSEVLEWLEKNNIPVFGHLGVGIIHPCFSKQQESKIPELMKFVRKLRGQVTGEHGIGLTKKQFLDKTEKDLYLAVKKRNDSLNKFNMNKIIDS